MSSPFVFLLSAEVHVHAHEDQRPEQRRDHGGAYRLQGVEIRAVVVGRGDDAAGDQIEGHEPADAEAPAGGCGAEHLRSLLPRCSHSKRGKGAKRYGRSGTKRETRLELATLSLGS